LGKYNVDKKADYLHYHKMEELMLCEVIMSIKNFKLKISTKRTIKELETRY